MLHCALFTVFSSSAPAVFILFFKFKITLNYREDLGHWNKKRPRQSKKRVPGFQENIGRWKQSISVERDQA